MRRRSKSAGLRAELVEEELRGEEQRLRRGWPPTNPLLDALRAGESVVLPDWQVPDEHRPYALGWRSGIHWYRLADDRLTPLDAYPAPAPAAAAPDATT